MTAFDQAWDLIVKATFDEEAYNDFMRNYGHMMRGRGGLFASVPDAVRGGDPFDRLIPNADADEEWKFLEDLDIWYNPSTGEAFQQKYLEDEDEYEETQLRIPTPVGAGLEGKVFRIPGTNFVTKIPMSSMAPEVRGISEGAVDKVMRAPIEAYWSKVLSHQYPVNPYSVFASRHPLDQDKLSLNMVQELVDDYHPRLDDENFRNMNAIHQRLFDMKDVGDIFEDFMYDVDPTVYELEEMGKEQPSTSDLRTMAEDYPIYGDTDLRGNVYGNIILDYLSNTPFIEDEYGGLLPQEEIDKLLEAAIYEQERLPKRYRRFGGDIDSRVQRIIDELRESQEQGRLIGSDIDFADDRFAVQDSNFGRGAL
tara:strand:+ start:1787 stop:2884 length:1098 start_codon:yes stop_codon:yes gene_type:complete